MRKRGGTRRMKLKNKTRKSRRNKSRNRNRKIYGGYVNASVHQGQVKLLQDIKTFLVNNQLPISQVRKLEVNLDEAFRLLLDKNFSEYEPKEFNAGGVAVDGLIKLKEFLKNIADSTSLIKEGLTEIGRDATQVEVIGKQADDYRDRLEENFYVVNIPVKNN